MRDFIVNAYVRGALSTGGQVENVALEGSTAVYTKRRYRDRYNRAIVKRVAKHHNHSLKIKARIRAKGAQGQNWFNQRKSDWARGRARTQNLWILHVAGDWHTLLETSRPSKNPHLMRCMLTTNLDVEQRFANGTQEKLVFNYIYPKAPAETLSF